MKIFAFLMAVAVFALSLVPCADIDAASHQWKAEITAAHQHEKGWQDQCSPLCHCNCCSSASSHQFKAFTIRKPTVAKKLQPEFLPAPTSKIALPIWQPPQLV